MKRAAPAPMLASLSIRPPRSIASKYALQVLSVAGSLLLVSGATEMYFSFLEARKEIAKLQTAQAESAAKEIEQYLRSIESGIESVAKLPWGQPAFRAADKRQELRRLMTLYPAVSDLQDIDSAGRTVLFVSRVAPDIAAEQVELPGDPLPSVGVAPQATPSGFGPTFFRDGAEPYVRLTVREPEGSPVTTVASINLRFLADVVSRLRIGKQGRTYIVDSNDHLIAHPQATHVLRRLDMSSFPTVRAARQAARTGHPRSSAVDAVDLAGDPVIATSVGLLDTGWLLFVEQPRSEALEPALATLSRTLLLIGIGGGLAIVLSLFYARTMAAPIVKLSRAAKKIAAGDLASHIDVDTSDEVGQLAEDFNVMTTRLEQSYRDLERRVEERTAELSAARDALQLRARQVSHLNQELLQQLQEVELRRNEAERANTAKSRFLAAASHDLRQPMHTVSLLVSVLRDRLQNQELGALAEKVRLSVDTMEHLFGSLLDISKLDAGAIQAQPESFLIDDLLRHIEQTYAPQAAEKGLRYRVMRSTAIVRSDPALLERIVGNLAANAIRYTRSGRVLVGCRRRAGALAVQVRDTGVGIPAADREDIFDEFFRLGADDPKQPKGLGLGLSIVKRSAEILGHPLALHSEVGRGSCFEVLVPYATAAPGSMRVGTLADVGRDRLAGTFVVIVDDDDDNRSALETLCIQWGLHVVTAASAQEAAVALDQHLRAPDIILTDFRLADQADGLSAIEHLRRAVGETTPAIIVTGDVTNERLRRATASGVTVINKPANADRLLQAIDDSISRSCRPTRGA